MNRKHLSTSKKLRNELVETLTGWGLLAMCLSTHDCEDGGHQWLQWILRLSQSHLRAAAKHTMKLEEETALGARELRTDQGRQCLVGDKSIAMVQSGLQSGR